MVNIALNVWNFEGSKPRKKENGGVKTIFARNVAKMRFRTVNARARNAEQIAHYTDRKSRRARKTDITNDSENSKITFIRNGWKPGCVHVAAKEKPLMVGKSAICALQKTQKRTEMYATRMG